MGVQARILARACDLHSIVLATRFLRGRMNADTSHKPSLGTDRLIGQAVQGVRALLTSSAALPPPWVRFIGA